MTTRSLLRALGILPLLLAGCSLTPETIVSNIILPEQRDLVLRSPEQFAPVPVPSLPPPRTVSDPREGTPEWRLSLDEAIRIALENARVVRVLGGLTASSSGQTIYDAAITNTAIDQAQARFDPNFTWTNSFNHTDTPMAVFDPLNPGMSLITSTPTDDYRLALGLTKTNVLGGQWAVNATENPLRISNAPPGSLPLNPQNRSTFDIGYTQPLLQGAGFAVNTAPIVIARLDTERSFFQYKDSVQEMVRGVIEAYWGMIQARTEVWARKIQVELSKSALDVAQANLKVGRKDLSEVAQARVTYNQFRASLIAAEASVLAREGALRNILGLPPEDMRQIIPVSVPTSMRLKHDWDAIVGLAEQQRPDIIELKLVLDADRQRLLQAENLTLPKLDANALYRWNGLDGVMPNGERLSSGSGKFMDWTLGINFSVPIGFRDGRARTRQQQLLIVRDQANIEQQLHAAFHTLAISLRDLDSAYDQYVVFKETRAGALVNLEVQIARFRTGQNIFLNVLQALNDWGNTVTSESQTLINYNVALATLERQTGTILQTHGLVFYEEHKRFAGPLGVFGHGRDYPSATPPIGSPHRYPATNAPGENVFDLQRPELRPGSKQGRDLLPPPTPVKP
jgi:outer membrane protein TolC